MKPLYLAWAISLLLCGTISEWAVAAQTTVAACDGKFSRPYYKTRGHYCSPGQLMPDAYEINKRIRCEEMEIDHLVSLRQAWDSGICGEVLTRFANDPRNLKFTHWQTNRSKGYLPPEVFARTRPKQVSNMINRDAMAVMRAYKIKSSDQILSDRILEYAKNSSVRSKIPLSSLSHAIQQKITYKKIGGKTIAFLGKRAIGYAIGVGAAVEAIMVAGWAAEWLTSPSQDDRMKVRAVLLKAVLEGNK